MNVTDPLLLLAVVLVSVTFGVILLLGYLVTRCLRSDGWDKSNITNALRLLSHVVLHPEDFGHMYYVKWNVGGGGTYSRRKAFPYLSLDELSEVVQTRPTEEERA